MATISQMLEKAKAAQQQSYAPYSRFQVGACIRTTTNKIFSGCNYENASYSLTLCAEGAAIAAMITAGEREIAEIVIIGLSAEPCPPCGSCRQRIREFANPNTLIHAFSKDGKHHITQTMNELLPNSFGPDYLK